MSVIAIFRQPSFGADIAGHQNDPYNSAVRQPQPFNSKDPFAQHIFRSVVAGLLTVLVTATVLHIYGAPDLATAFVVPIAAAGFLAFLALFTAWSQHRRGSGVLWFLLTLLALPTLGYAVLLLFRVPLASQPAKFLPMIPQALLAAPIYRAIEKRYRTSAQG